MSKRKFNIGDKVTVITGNCAGKSGTIINIFNKNSRKEYFIEFNNGEYGNYLSYNLQFADLHILANYLDKHGDLPELSKKEKEEMETYGPFGYIPNFNKEEKKLKNKETMQNDVNKALSKGICKYCGVPFDEIEESTEEKGACEYCIEQRKHVSKINFRKSCYVDMNEFSAFGHEGDWIEVTEWTNGEGIDICIHYANDHDETDHIFKLSYDELMAIMNIINKFGTLQPVFTKSENSNN